MMACKMSEKYITIRAVKHNVYIIVFKPSSMVFYCEDLKDATNFIQKFHSTCLNSDHLTTILIIVRNHQNNILQLFYIRRNMHYSSYKYDPMFQNTYEHMLHTAKTINLPLSFISSDICKDLTNIINIIYNDDVNNVYDINCKAEHEHDGLKWFNKDSKIIEYKYKHIDIPNDFNTDFNKVNPNISIDQCKDITLKYIYAVTKIQREIHDAEHGVYIRLFKIDNNHPIMSNAYDANDYLYVKELFDTERERDMFKDENKVLKERCTKLEDENKEQDEKIKEQEKEINKLKEEMLKKDEENKELQERCNSLQKQVDNLSAKITELFKRFDNYR